MSVQNFLNGSGYHADNWTTIFDVDYSAPGHMTWGDFEERHDLIQWMFPTMRPSKAQPHSPVLTWADVQAIVADEDCMHGIAGASEYYLEFLRNNPDIWLRGSDHNHLRITRAIESLGLLVDTQTARAFHIQVSAWNRAKSWPVNIASVGYWNKAVHYGDLMRAKNKEEL